jgi:hypothetical protein
VALAILMELNIRLTVLVVETARLERRGVNDNHKLPKSQQALQLKKKANKKLIEVLLIQNLVF